MFEFSGCHDVTVLTFFAGKKAKIGGLKGKDKGDFLKYIAISVGSTAKGRGTDFAFN